MSTVIFIVCFLVGDWNLPVGFLRAGYEVQELTPVSKKCHFYGGEGAFLPV